MCNFQNRVEILRYLKSLPFAKEASYEEILEMIEQKHLYGKGLGWIDMHLLASAYLSNARLWTKDKNLSRYSTGTF